VNRLRAGLESAKARAQDATTQLQHMHTELSDMREEASRARSELAEEVRWRTQLQQHLIDLKAELQVAQEELAHMHTHTELAAVQAEANRFSLALMSIKQDLEREGRTCKILEVEVKELRGEPQASTRGLTGVQCGRGEGCNAMSQQNLEEEVGCGQTD
jgi:chromosome segregation ATPase